MEQCLIWTNVATAIVSFALGSALTPKRTQSQDNSVTGAQSAKFSHSISSDRPADRAYRDERSKPLLKGFTLPSEDEE